MTANAVTDSQAVVQLKRRLALIALALIALALKEECNGE